MAQTKAQVTVLKTKPESVLSDYTRLLHLADYQKILPRDQDIIIKLNLSWTKYFPACSSAPWQVEGVIKTLLEDGYARQKLIPAENKTVVTHPRLGAINNKWHRIFDQYGLRFIALPEVKWRKYRFKSQLLILNQIFPEGIEIPEMYPGKNIIHLPTIKTHGHSIMTGSVKNSFGGLLKEVRHYCHKYIHETLVDLMIMQKELHPRIFTVMDGTVCGDGPGPRTMMPVIKNYLLASADAVAIDAVSSRLMGFDPMAIPFIRMCHDRGLGCGDPRQIEIIGEDITGVNFGFKTSRSFVIWGDQMLRKGFLKFLEKPALHSPLVVWAPFASNVYHDLIWYPLIGKRRINRFYQTGWGKLFKKY